jgi:deoxyribodipyrimidine photo-lyase
MTPVHIIWFKRDLSIHDNAALSQAAQSGPVVPLYIMEPDLWAQPDVSYRQYDFLYHSLRDLNSDLSRLGTPLVVRVGDAITVLEALRQSHQSQGYIPIKKRGICGPMPVIDGCWIGANTTISHGMNPSEMVSFGD